MKSKTEIADLFTFIAAVLLLVLWGYAAVSKVADYHRFVLQMQLAPVPFMKLSAPILGWLIPAIEFTLVGMLLTDRFRRLGLLFSFLLLLVFELYIFAMLLSGLDLPCTCGGLISKLQWNEHLIFNAVFMVIAIAPLLNKYLSKDDSSEYSPRTGVGVDI